MAAQAEDALRCPGVAKIFNLPLAVPAAEAHRTECLVVCQNSEVLDLVATCATAVVAVIADEDSVSQEE